jgi:hypothetical protein
MTLSEAFMATQTEVLRQILQTQQQIAQQMNRGPPHGANHEGPNQVTTYAQFIGMKPLTFSKAEDPLEAESLGQGHRGEVLCLCAALLRGEQSQLRSSAAARRSFNVVGSFQVNVVRACCNLG